MSNDVFTRHVTPNATPQNEQARADQVVNNDGGYVFKVADKTRLNRFLTIGTEGGTYYQQEKALTRQNAAEVVRLAENSSPALIWDTVRVSQAGRAPRNNPALFALAAAAGLGNTAYRQQALDALPLVARTGTHFLTFCEYAQMFRGWGPQLCKGTANWFKRFNATGMDVEQWQAGHADAEAHPKTIDDLAYQLLKYKQRDGWAMRDVMRLANSKNALKSGATPGQLALFDYVMKGEFNADLLPPIVDVAEQAHETRNTADWTRLIASNQSLSWEMLPSEALAEKDVWVALIECGNLPLGALLRNLGRLTRLGVIGPLNAFNKVVTAKLTSPQAVLGARIHPIAVLVALKTYGLGHGIKGKSTWTPNPQVMDALNDMFYLAFGNVVPSGKRTVIALDVSSSMGMNIADYPFTAREIAAAMALITAKTEPEYVITAFSNVFTPISISPSQRLDDVTRSVSGLNFGWTDMSLPMRWAQQQNIGVDTFQIWTDNEVNRSTMHPFEALRAYRQFSGINAKLQVCAVTPTEFSIADPTDPGMLDVSGFDAAVPNLLADHARGAL
jgi:60 kDa SS-A/Ro ribonucleoprotein